MWFQEDHSTLDHLVRFKTFIKIAFVRKEHVLTVFFDLEKTYDTTWKHGILATWQTSGISVPGVIYLSLLKVFDQNVPLKSEWAPLYQSCMNRRWGFRKAASCLRRFLASK